MFSFDISHMGYENAMQILSTAILNNKQISCQIDFNADHSRSKIIRDFVGQIFDKYQIHYPWRGRFILITDELINNAIEHGSADGDIDTCIIEAGMDINNAFYISIEVHDTGC